MSTDRTLRPTSMDAWRPLGRSEPPTAVGRPQRNVQSVRRRVRAIAAFSLVALTTRGSALAGTADVVSASADCSGSVCTFVVTVQHDDEGWSHYANAWQVLTPDGAVLATRVLRHPHVGEQPFTRQLRGVEVPAGLTIVRIRARDSVHGFGGREIDVPLGRSRSD